MLSRCSRSLLSSSWKYSRFFSAQSVGYSPIHPVEATSPEITLFQSLQERLEQLVPQKQAEIKELKKQYGDKVLGEVTVNQVIGGMRGISGLLTETSLLDAQEGIRFRGLSIPEMEKTLPKLPGTEHPISEGMLWLLITGEVPSLAQAQSLTDEFHKRSKLPNHVTSLLDSYPKEMHPMTQLSSAVLALQTESKFAAAYEQGENRVNFWRHYLEDSLDLLARLPEVAARIFQNVFRDGSTPGYDDSLDWAANYAHMMGFNSPQVADLMRMYVNIHSDHEGGNVSAHATHLVGSALSDAYLSLSAGLNGLAGPLHGLANQEVLRWVISLRERLGTTNATKEQLRDAVWDTLNNGQVIPGYGHAVLRKTDPRYICQREFALKHLPDDPLFKLVSDLYEVVPEVLTEHGKTANPWPNVDAHSGVLLSHYGLTESRYYTVLFGVSRALGVLASLVNDRILGLPIERPKSLTSEFIRQRFE